MEAFEFTAPQFRGGTDATDAYVFWLAGEESAVRTFAARLNLVYCQTLNFTELSGVDAVVL